MADTRPRLSPNVAAAVVLVVLAGALLVWQRPWESSGTSSDRGTPAALPTDAPSLLTAQLRAMSAARTEADFVAATGASGAARDFGRRTWSSLQALGATDLELRYISGGDVADRADGSAQAVTEVSWRAGPESGLGSTAVHRSSVVLRVAPREDGTLSIVGASPRVGVMPIWLVGSVVVDRGPGTVAVTVDGGDAAVPVVSMGSVAQRAVRSIVPGTSGDVIVVSPRTQAEMARIVGQKVDAIAQIAAVTTRLDDRGQDGSRAVIVINPAVFATMDQRAAQVVLTHEATHLLTGAVGTRAETWVVEGFADFVALHDDTVPLSVSAGQALARVKAGELPSRLPGAEEFSSTGRGLGAVYESTWLIFRMLGERYPDADIVAFYDSVLGGRSVSSALESSFGITEKQLTAAWRAYLTKSASTVS